MGTIHLAATLSFLCAALAAAGNAVANVAQRKASLEEAPDVAFSASVLAGILRRPVWIAGFAAMVAAFALQAVALDLAPLAAVEPVITLEVPLTLLVASRAFHVGIHRQEWAGIWTMTAGMIVLVAALDPRSGNAEHVNHFTYLAAGGGTAATIFALLAASRRGSRLWRTACLGAATGACFGLTATMVKEAVTALSDHGLIAMLTTWQTYVAMAFGIAGVIVMQAALHTGPLVAAQPGFTLMDPLVSMLWGILVFHEGARGGRWLVLAAVGTIMIGVGVFVLSRSPLLASLNEELPQQSTAAPIPAPAT